MTKKRGPGRPRLPNGDARVPMTTYLHPDLLEKINERADAADCSRTEFVREFLEREFGFDEGVDMDQIMETVRNIEARDQ